MKKEKNQNTESADWGSCLKFYTPLELIEITLNAIFSELDIPFSMLKFFFNVKNENINCNIVFIKSFFRTR